MTSPITSSDTVNAIKIALDGLARREEVIGRNLANVDTPGYKSQDLNFEDAVRQAVRANETGSLPMAATHGAHLAAPEQRAIVFQTALRPGGSERADGNNVDPDVELNQMTETGVRYQALTQMISKKFNLIKTITASR